VDTAFLTQLANQLRIGKTPGCRRAINRILEEIKGGCENSKYDSPIAAEAAFREFAERERSCQKPVLGKSNA
jgi:hypothetical protein